MTPVHTEPLQVTPPAEVAEVHFDDDMEKRIREILKRYPTKQAAVLPLLWMCQERWGWTSPGIMNAVAERLELAPAFVEGVVTFYTMYQTEPPGKYLLQVCTTLSCQLCGTSGLVDHLKERLGIDFGETTRDGRFTLLDVQCLGACGEAPIIQVNNDYYTELTPEKLDQLLDELV
ncbi:MAG: NADH-quinone oxidoreductase subunit NuoE [Acidobacteria bacterium]|jgi:NADH-quinone oxidoreductase E subunit|nr:NADH-quinone oxidoreductase subunit NuoE [Acidobacteriota bacterium]